MGNFEDNYWHRLWCRASCGPKVETTFTVHGLNIDETVNKFTKGSEKGQLCSCPAQIPAHYQNGRFDVFGCLQWTSPHRPILVFSSTVINCFNNRRQPYMCHTYSNYLTTGSTHGHTNTHVLSLSLSLSLSEKESGLSLCRPALPTIGAPPPPRI